MEFTAKQIAEFLGGRVEGNEDARVNTFAKIEEGKEGAITFLSNAKYTSFIYDTKASIDTGAQKLTDYWGKLLSENYSVTPRDLSKQQELEWNYTVDYTNKFLQKAEERINKGIRGAFYENASLKEVLYNKAS